ncbi:MAG: N-acetylmuramoyl-L-alanine amidase [Candidatus Binatia bacterium]
MRIVNHKLEGDGQAVPFVESPNVGGALQADLLIMHFTAGSDAASSIESLTDPAAKASAHVVVGRDGAVTQLVPFDRVAWHAGASQWQGRTGLNAYSIGIELDNAGRLTRVGDHWESWFKRRYPDTEVIEARHRNDPPGDTASGWHDYTEAQIASAVALGRLLVTTYGLRDVLGHDDIAPRRKSDPGPAFPMASFHSRLVGRADGASQLFATTASLNIRSGPGTEHATLKGSPLPKGATVNVLERNGLWWKVDVMATVRTVMDLVGWVHSRYLRVV